MEPEIRPFDRMAASDAEYTMLAEIRNVFISEAMPDDPPTTVQNTKNQLQHIPPVFEVHAWMAWVGDRIVATSNIGIPHLETNQHLGQIDIYVHPDFRGQGIATKFLPQLVEIAEARERTMIVGNTYSTVPAGQSFMEALGGSLGLSMRRNDLQIVDVDAELVRTWIDRAAERAQGFEVIEFIGAYPDDQLVPISKMQLAINNMPTDNLDIEDFEYTPEQLKQMDESMTAQGNERWSLVAREKATGNYVGWTDLTFNPSKPHVADVGGTAVAAEYQNLGLGRWLKAAVIEKLLRERPNVTKVRTANAHSNVPMLKINDELGFKPALTTDLWQVATEKLRAYVDKHDVVRV